MINEVRIYIVSNMKVYCKNALPTKNNDNIPYCEWQGKLSEWNDHDKICQYKNIQCDYCKQHQCYRKDKDRHLKTCQYYPLLCDLKCGKQILRKDMHNHVNNICINTLIECKNNGCNQKIKRKDYQAHVRDQCTKRLIDCCYKKYGCNVGLIPFDTREQHIKHNKLEHILFKLDYNERKVDELSNENRKLKAYISNISNPSISLSDTGVIYFVTNNIVLQYKLRWCLLPHNLQYMNKNKTLDVGRIAAKLNSNANNQIRWNDIRLESKMDHYDVSKTNPKPSITNPYVYQLQCETEYGWSNWSPLQIVTSIWVKPKIRFNTFNRNHFTSLRNGKIIQSTSDSNFSQVAIAYDNNGLTSVGKYEIKIKCIKRDGLHDAFGIISKEVDIDNYSGYSNENGCIMYCFDGSDKSIFSKTPMGIRKLNSINWEKHDTLGMMLNFDESKIEFYYNGTMIRKLILFNAPEYYVFVQGYRNYHEYQVL